MESLGNIKSTNQNLELASAQRTSKPLVRGRLFLEEDDGLELPGIYPLNPINDRTQDLPCLRELLPKDNYNSLDNLSDTGGFPIRKRRCMSLNPEFLESNSNLPIVDPIVSDRKAMVSNFIYSLLKSKNKKAGVLKEVRGYVSKIFEKPLFDIYEQLSNEKALIIDGKSVTCDFLGHGNFHLVFGLVDSETRNDIGRVLKVPYKDSGDTTSFSNKLRTLGLSVLETKKEGGLITQEKCDMVFPEGTEREDYKHLCDFLNTNSLKSQELEAFLIQQVALYKEIVEETILKEGVNKDMYPIFDIRPANCGIHQGKWVLIDPGGETSDDMWYLHFNSCLKEWVNLFELINKPEISEKVEKLKYNA